MKTLTMNTDIISKLIQKLKPALAKHAALSDIDTVNAREQELQQRMIDLVADGCEGNLLVDTARELQTLRQNKEKQQEKLAEVTETIQKLKFLLSDTIAELDIDEKPAALEEFGL